MGKVYEGIDAALASWITKQPVWFVATAPLAADGHVNVSPRGHDSLSVLGPRDLLRLSAEKRGADGMDSYRAQKNATGTDGLPGL